MAIKQSTTKKRTASRKLPNTPRSKVKNVLRMLWLRSRERAQALKNSGRKCTRCGVQATQAKGKEQKIEVHHNKQPDWEAVIDLIFKEILCDPSLLTPFCPPCHDEEEGPGHKRGNKPVDMATLEEVVW